MPGSPSLTETLIAIARDGMGQPEPVLFRFMVNGFERDHEWIQDSVWARTADEAEWQHRESMLGTGWRFESVDCVPDAMKLSDGTVVLLDRASALKIVLHNAL